MIGILTRDLDHRQAATLMRSKWTWFLALGLVVILCGALAIVLPAVSNIIASTVLGVALAIAGIVKIVQALQVKQWSGFVWQELTGAVELVGGILIYFNPVKGALAIALLVALVLFIQGIGQCGVAFKVRPEAGWRWLLASGLVSLVASAAVTLKLPYVRFYAPGTIAGIALLIAGCAYVVIALAVREARA
ncbi:HdeD family acid-resistance protein [Microbacteriaceae bacterium K1510]|nr:HdeD family acid-resistance protein [Microbacteriaceae bacterium K1510]